MNDKVYDIKEVSQLLNLSPCYVRRMIHKGKIHPIKVQVSENVWKHGVTESELNRWRSSTKTRIRRKDGKVGLKGYLSLEDREKVINFLKEQNIEITK